MFKHVNMLKIKRDIQLIDQQYFKIVNLHFDKSEKCLFTRSCESRQESEHSN